MSLLQRIKQKLSVSSRGAKYEMFLQEFEPTERSTLLDVGYTEIEHHPSDNMIEKRYPHLAQVTALGIEENEQFSARYPDVRVVKYDGAIFPFENDSFDLCWSNAVIEHVGQWDAQVRFIREMVRTSSGVFFTTPNRWFPFELHTNIPLLHWLPKRVFDKFLPVFGKSWAAGDYMYLLSKRQLHRLMAEAEVPRESYRIVASRFAGFATTWIVIVNAKRRPVTDGAANHLVTEMPLKQSLGDAPATAALQEAQMMD